MLVLQEKGAKVLYSDPYVPVLDGMKSEALTAATIARADCVVILTDHRVVDYAMVQHSAKCVVDTRNAIGGHHHNVYRLGAPAPPQAAILPAEDEAKVVA